MKRTLALLALIALGSLLEPAARADSWTISLLPGADISGAPGSTIGWGFTIMNDSSSTLFLDNLSADLFQSATPNAELFSFPMVDPNSTLTVDYVPGMYGLYELTWDANAPIGFVNGGTFLVSAQWCDAGGIVCTDAPDQSVAFSATVSAPVGVPEPATLLLLAAGLAPMVMKRKRHF